jgi:hypothetical protein
MTRFLYAAAEHLTASLRRRICQKVTDVFHFPECSYNACKL